MRLKILYNKNILFQRKGTDVLNQEKEILISLRGLGKDFPSGNGVINALQNIDLDIYENEFMVIHGESGSGKSTLINIIGGMDTLTKGKIIAFGQDLNRISERDLTKYRRKNIGFIFQNYNLMPNLTAEENVQYIADLVKDPMDVKEAIEKVGLTDRADHFPGQLSGGQQQRVAIARAIVKRPKLILADEPTAALDHARSIEVLSFIEKIVKNDKTTVVMVTHNAEIAKMADRTVKISNGRITQIRENKNPLHAEDLVW
ncbi:MAG: ABC transporter ATP-binding protein [Lachnospiraceae bacterium]|nr:ABC transporter ATP-binding protein [Lachnospiraceae bacterium]